MVAAGSITVAGAERYSFLLESHQLTAYSQFESARRQQLKQRVSQNLASIQQ